MLHRFVNNSWKILSSQTIGVEFASKIVHIVPREHHGGASGPRKRIKLQLWDTAGTERFRSVSRSYYRGAAAAILIYDVSSWRSFEGLRTFLEDIRALAGPQCTIVLAGNKVDVAEAQQPQNSSSNDSSAYGSYGSEAGAFPDTPISASASLSASSLSSRLSNATAIDRSRKTIAPEGREVPFETASRWAGQNGIPVAVEVSAFSGENVDDLFERLARMILTKIELGDIDPDDPRSGIQYGDIGGWGVDDGNASVRSGGGRRGGGGGQLREWEEVFRLSGSTGRRRPCC